MFCRYKLYDLHILSGNSVEAALTLKKHANLLKWTDEKLEEHLLTKNLHRNCETQMELKEKIYIEVFAVPSFSPYRFVFVDDRTVRQRSTLGVSC